MKNILKSIVLVLLFSTTTTLVGLSQNTFSGTIKYRITAEGRELSAQEKAQMPTEQIISVRSPFTKTENITAMGGLSTIANSETGITIILLDMMGQKIAFKSEKNDTTEEKQLEPTINDLEETKTILGYKCKKYEIVLEEGAIEAFVTDKIDVKDPVLSSIKGLDGFMMEFSQTSKEDEDIIIIYTVTEIKKGKVKKSVFKIPAGYEEKTMDDLKNMMGG